MTANRGKDSLCTETEIDRMELRNIATTWLSPARSNASFGVCVFMQLSACSPVGPRLRPERFKSCRLQASWYPSWGHARTLAKTGVGPRATDKHRAWPTAAPDLKHSGLGPPGARHRNFTGLGPPGVSTPTLPASGRWRPRASRICAIYFVAPGIRARPVLLQGAGLYVSTA